MVILDIVLPQKFINIFWNIVAEIPTLRRKVSDAAKSYLKFEKSNCDETKQQMLLDEVITYEDCILDI